MSNFNKLAKQALPLAMIAMLSGSYYLMNDWTVPSGQPNPGMPQLLSEHDGRLRQLPTRPAPTVGSPRTDVRKIASVPGVGSEQVQKASGQLAGGPAHLGLEQGDLDDFELTLAQDSDGRQEPVTSLITTGQPATPQFAALPPRAEQESGTAKTHSSASSVGTANSVPTGIGTGNGHLLRNPYINASSDRAQHQEAFKQVVSGPVITTPQSAPLPGSRQSNAASETGTPSIAEGRSNVVSGTVGHQNQTELPEAAVTSGLALTGPTDNDLSVGQAANRSQPSQFNTQGNDEETQMVSVVDRNETTTAQPELVLQSSQPLPNRGASVPARPPSPGPLSPAVEAQVLQHLEYGNSLARRSATLLAKREFIKGLRLLAETADNETGSYLHLAALQEGFTALKEVQEFEGGDDVLDLDIGRVAETHDTPLIRDGHYAARIPSQARKGYLLFAQDRLVQSVGRHDISAELLHALGKTYWVDALYNSGSARLDYSRAAILFQSALVINPSHVRSANELGVILARSGRLEESKTLFQNAVQSQRNFTEAWKNLAKVHQQLGEVQLAKLATQEARMVESPEIQPVQLLETEQFNERIGAWGIPPQQASTNESQVQPFGSSPAAASAVGRPVDTEPAKKSWLPHFDRTATSDRNQTGRSTETPGTFQRFGGF